MLRLSPIQVRWFRLRRSGLVQPFQSPHAAARALAGVQAQILPAAGLALWNRTRGLSYAGFQNQLFGQRSLIKLWGQRGTLHIYASDEWPLIHGALAGCKTWWERQAERAGQDLAAHQALVSQVGQMLRERGTMGRSDLRASGLDLDEENFSSWGGIFAELVRKGWACHARQEGNEGLFAHREHWLPGLDWNPPAPDEANGELARRYLAAYGPAPVQDLAYWRGSPARDAQRWLNRLGDQVIEVEADGQMALALREDLEALSEAPPPRDEWPVRLLYRFDPLLLAARDKTWVIAPSYYDQVWRPAGHIEGTIVEWGRAVGTWRYDRSGSGLVVSAELFGRCPRRVRTTVREQAERIAEFFGLPLARVAC